MPKGINFDEYYGIEQLVIAELTETKDPETGEIIETYGDVMPLSGVQSASSEVNEATETHYYDNMSAIVIDTEGDDTYTFVVSVVDKATRAKIEGSTYDAETGALIGSKKRKKYFAVGFIGNKVNGPDEYVWIYKGKFNRGTIDQNTRTDSADTSNMEYTFTSIHSSTKYTKGGNVKHLIVDNDGKADLSTFFDVVTTPDMLRPVTPATSYKLTKTQAEDTVLSVKRNNIELENDADIFKNDLLFITCDGGTVTVNGLNLGIGGVFAVNGNTTVISTAED